MEQIYEDATPEEEKNGKRIIDMQIHLDMKERRLNHRSISLQKNQKRKKL